jgi:hypothetical protein
MCRKPDLASEGRRGWDSIRGRWEACIVPSKHTNLDLAAHDQQTAAGSSSHVKQEEIDVDSKLNSTLRVNASKHFNSGDLS